MTPVAPLHFCVAGVAQSYIHGRFAWQAWHLVTSTVVLRRFAWAGVALMVLGGALGPGLGGRDAGGAASLCVAGVAQILHPRSFCVGRRGTW